MTSFLSQRFAFCLVFLLAGINGAAGQEQVDGKLSGQLKLDETWDSDIYLSSIPTFEDMYAISNENIISRATIDSLGYFEFDLTFLPEEDNLFRLHIIKKGDAPASLFIGGKDENHFFFIANRHSDIVFEAMSYSPPFRKVRFIRSAENSAFQKITNLVNVADSIASESGIAKRRFIEDKLYEELVAIADTASNPLVSLYALYRSKFQSRYPSNLDFYATYLKKWRSQKSAYFKAFRSNLDIKTDGNNRTVIVLAGSMIFALGFFIGRLNLRKVSKVEKLSIQERKIYELLRQGASNQEISDHHHIEISTVKSHVSNIFSKLNVKSRRELMNM